MLLDRMRTRFLFDRGVRLAERGNYQRALTYFEEVMQREPDYALAYANIGFCHYKLGAAGDAQRAYEQAQELDPNDPDTYYELGCIHHGQGQRNAALECFRETLRLQPNHAEAYTAMEQVRIELGMPAIETAPEPTADRATGQTKQPDLAEQVLQLLRKGEDAYEEGNMEAALEAWNEAAKLDGKNPRIHNNRAAAFFELQRHKEAIDACAHALRIDPNYTIAHVTRAEIFAALGNRDAVMREYAALNGVDDELAQQVLDLVKDAEQAQ
ncbi:MAG: tetratricopeptide repeat protein [Candidatus Hydrogenedentes bacterium]|nr:tetratricopeptide repeat protein [Candidatus Hydrogenedentota bacterium]